MQVVKDKKREDVHLTTCQIIEVVIGCMALGALFSLKYIFPGSPFIMKYFSGLPQFVMIIFFFIILFYVDRYFFMRGKIKAKKDED
ncbi:hypothetical protein DENIS_0898 [Desulfonema ishimotonii]|uniref:Uncharacterized protein n=1 Tax=Desulfonema ishimotonii TaxID=45657 RepID=A0A401FSM3_9BACT|nr:hypothetical protein [Desulfonema ishimotonii]GBC59956.1 hypothetical protein DENIS_0898 [Desulfonema ishimotonii]